MADSKLPPIPEVDLDAHRGDAETIARVFKRAGVPLDCIAVLTGVEKSADPIARELRAVARLLVVDAIKEDRRWTERVKLLETRIDFAVDALRGKVELDRE